MTRRKQWSDRPMPVRVPQYGVWTEERAGTHTLNLEYMRLSVVWNHLYYPDQWSATATAFFDTKHLQSKTVEEAKAEALGILHGALDVVLRHAERAQS